MIAPFDPPAALTNPHLQTVLASIGPRRCQAPRIQHALDSETLILEADDGTRLLAEWDRCGPASGGLAVLLHGWEGCSRSPYQIFAARHLLALDFDVLRINFRDHGDSHHLNRELFNSTRSPEVAGALVNFLSKTSYSEVFLGGYSLGGNFALRIATDTATSLPLAAVVAICPPVDPANAMAALNNGWFVYERYFFHRWSRSLEKKLACFPELDYGAELTRAKTVDDLNDLFIHRFTEFPDKANYFDAYALSGNRLSGLRVPATVIASADDPIIPVSDLHKMDPNPHLALALQQRGGHCGFLETWCGLGWAERAMTEIFLRYRTVAPW